MFLSKEEEKILDGEKGWILERAMRLLTTIGDLNNAERLVPIKRSQVAGVSYKTVGDPTLHLVEELARETVRVRTKATQNPAGMDLKRWREMGVPEGFAEKQLRICRAYEKLGVEALCTCTPYLSGNRPEFGEVVGFSESSAVAFVNSVVGARTNRHGGLDALSAALIGKVPLMGYLLDENRTGDVHVKVCFKPRKETDYSALGYYVGKEIETSEVPVYDGIKDASSDELKLLGAASAASGSVALFHVLGLTPEARNIRRAFGGKKPKYKLEVAREEIRSVYDELSTRENPDLVAIGCPHSSVQELKKIAELISGRKVKRSIKLWVFTSPKVFEEAEKSGYISIIRSAGGDVFLNTCMVVAPIEEIGFRCVYTNSAKAAFYIPRMTKNRCKSGIAPLRTCIEMCTTS